MGLPVSFLTSRAAIRSHFTFAADRETLFVHSSTSQAGVTGLLGVVYVLHDSRAGDRFSELMGMISGCIHDLSHWQGCRLILSFAFPEEDSNLDTEMPDDCPPFLPRTEDTYAVLL
jgi:hypothetical protein